MWGSLRLAPIKQQAIYAQRSMYDDINIPLDTFTSIVEAKKWQANPQMFASLNIVVLITSPCTSTPTVDREIFVVKIFSSMTFSDKN